MKKAEGQRVKDIVTETMSHTVLFESELEGVGEGGSKCTTDL